ncbi:MAG: aminodeoxychorismate synthase component I [Gammaproteobacteria bacterium]|nr:aminodeoxychorismate synthase component I [Gammaproteobacteria bacterium]NNF61829.1 aminodeoxychorismate synthase component I [Gammaproteobacteria bacterium]
MLQLHALNPERYPYFLDSAAAGTPHGRFDILFAFPGKSIWLDATQRLHGATGDTSDFLDALDRWLRAEQPCAPVSALPFCSGWFVYLGYELAQQIEPTLRLPMPSGLPVAFATRMGAAVIRDHRTDTMFVTADDPADAALIGSDINSLPRHDPDGDRMMLSAVREEEPGQFINAVMQAKRHIYAGDVFQANLSRGWHARLFGPVADVGLYRRLRASNPGPFAGLVRWGDNAIISSSPERLLQVLDGRASTRPIAGTRPRGQSAEDDEELSHELLDNAKELAEHTMLIDLERNDLGRVCAAGSVVVDEMMTLETYAHVHHIVSNVTGTLRDDVSAVHAMRAVFPGGTITGCPKVRCMEIIAQLEQAARGAYTGSFGYLDRSGNCDLNILIRTLVRNGREISVRAGAGIVADSIPEHELEETRAKARGMLQALGAEL